MSIELIAEARRLAELNRTEGWNGNDCDAAMRMLNALADELERLVGKARER